MKLEEKRPSWKALKIYYRIPGMRVWKYGRKWSSDNIQISVMKVEVEITHKKPNLQAR